MHRSECPMVNCTGQDYAYQGNTTVASFGTQYHEYAAEWGVDYIEFYVDSKMYSRVTLATVANNRDPPTPSPFFPPEAMYMLLNTAVGVYTNQPVDESTVFPALHYIEYVRVAQPKPTFLFQ